MRQIIINRPRSLECADAPLNVSINGKRLAKIGNSQRIIIQTDDGPQEIRVHGSLWRGRAFADTVNIPAGSYCYELQVDFISVNGSKYEPLLRPCSGEFIKDDSRTIALLGSTLCKRLLDEKLREELKKLPETRLQLVIEPTMWKLMLGLGGTEKVLFQSEYSHVKGGLAAAVINALEFGDLTTPEGRTKICEKVLDDYASCLPEYERLGADGLVFKG